MTFHWLNACHRQESTAHFTPDASNTHTNRSVCQSNANITMFRSLYVVLLACLTLWVEGQDLCCLCNNCDFPVRPNYKVDSAGTTCASIDLKMGNPFQTPKGSAQCSSMYQKYHNMCCNDSYNPPQVAQQAPADELGPEDIKWDGPYQRCNICKDNSTPRYVSA